MLEKSISKFRILWIFGFIFLVSSCLHSKKTPICKETDGACLKINFQFEPLSLDPRYGFDSKSQTIIKSLFEGLTRMGLDGNIHPAMAESITISEDQKIYDFTLRDCFWTNGLPVTATDFAYTWKSVLSSHSACPLADLFYPIKNARKAKENAECLNEVGIYVIDDKTLRVELEHPAPYFLHLLSNPLFFAVCQKVDLIDPEWSRKTEQGFVCNGPFILKTWQSEQQMVLEKNMAYHDQKAVQLAHIHISFVKDPYTSLLMFEKGEIDWMGEPFCKIPLEALPALIATHQLRIRPYAGLYWLECNTERFPLNSPNIRKALAFAIDRKSLVDYVLIGQKVAFSVVPEMMCVLKEEEYFLGDDLQKAKEYFELGLKELGITREQFPSIKLSYSTIPGYRAVAEALQQQWENRLGIQVDLECFFEWGVYLSNFSKRDYQIAQIGWTSFYNDPIYNLQVFRYRSNVNNWTSWENGAFQALLNKADYETSPLARDAYLREAEKILIDEMPIIPLSYQTCKYIKKDNVKNLLVSDLGEVDFKWTSVQ